MDKEQAYQTAVDAVVALVKNRGADARVSFDAIWRYAEKDVPSVQRSPLAKRLERAGHIERTGHLIKTESESRRSNAGAEYKPGPLFFAAAKLAGGKNAATESVASALKAMGSAMDARGFIVTPEQLTNFYLALLASP